MPTPITSKHDLLDLLSGIATLDADGVAHALEQACTPDVRWEFYHPFNTIVSGTAAATGFWNPLRQSFPNYEYRPNLCIAGTFEGGTWISTLGHVLGSFTREWLGIPPTHRMAYLRFAMTAEIVDGRIARCYVHFDLLDLLRQAGVYPLRAMPGSAEHWAAPPCSTGVTTDPQTSARTLASVLDMQESLGFDMDPDNPQLAEHSPRWHPDMNWFGPAGIGSTRGQSEFLDYHCALFDIGFPDATFPNFYDGDTDIPPGRRSNPNHYIQLAEGRLAVTGGWPSVAGTHTGPGWLGLPPTGRPVRMRVADWYRVDADNLIVDNWVMIDVAHILLQCGLDVLDDLRHAVDPTYHRWRTTASLPEHA